MNSSLIGECRGGGGGAWDPVHGATGKRRGAGDVQAAEGGSVWGDSGRGSKDRLSEAVAAATHVAADQISVAAFELCGPHHVAGDDSWFEAGRESFDLRLDAIDVRR